MQTSLHLKWPHLEEDQSIQVKRRQGKFLVIKSSTKRSNPSSFHDYTATTGATEKLYIQVEELNSHFYMLYWLNDLEHNQSISSRMSEY